MGVEANAPNELVPVNAKRHLSFSLATVLESIAVLVVSRVFARSWLWAGQLAPGADHSGGGRPTGLAASDVAAPAATAPAAHTVATIRCAMRILISVIVALLAAPVAAAANTIVFQATVGATRQLFTIRPDGTGLRQLTASGGEQPAWSPDGREIAFDAPSGAGTALFTVRADGTRLGALRLGLSGSSAAPDWSPDGTKLAFDHSEPSENGIFVAGVDGSRPRRITAGLALPNAYDTAATWSPDGAHLCFTRVRNARESALYVVGIDGEGLRRLTPWSLDASAASWAPDGSKLVFESYSTPHPGRSANLFTIRPGGGAMTQLTHFTGGATHGFGPSYSPDGTQIVWHKLGPHVNQLFVMDADGRNQRQLTHLPGNPKISHPDWG